MYADNTEIRDNILYQGDVLDQFPYFRIPKRFNLFEQVSVEGNPTDEYRLNRVDNLPEDKSLVGIEVHKERVMILSQTCDIQQRDNIVVAKVYDLNKEVTEGRLSAGRADGIRQRTNKFWFYLPEKEGVLPESFVDLQAPHYLPKELASNLIENRMISLSHWGRHHLAWAMSEFFGRPIQDIE